jgi:hypothetical protein
MKQADATISQPPYASLVNVSQSPGQGDDWQVRIVETSGVPEGLDPSVARGLLFAIPLSGMLWGALYGLYRVFAG